LDIVDLRDVCISPSVVRRVKSRRLRWAGYVTRSGETRNAYIILRGGTS
jgi:hypothetical protein